LSILKYDCENSLFKDYHLKPGIVMWILDLLISGRYPRQDSPLDPTNGRLARPRIIGTYPRD